MINRMSCCAFEEGLMKSKGFRDVEMDSKHSGQGVSFCSIGCVIASIFCREVRIHVFSNTQKSFLEIPCRDGLIKLISQFFNIPKSKHRKYD